MRRRFSASEVDYSITPRAGELGNDSMNDIVIAQVSCVRDQDQRKKDRVANSTCVVVQVMVCVLRSDWDWSPSLGE